MRVTNNSIASMTLANLQSSLQRGAALQQQLSSGRRINKASDDPSGTVAALALQGEIDRNNQYTRNANDGNGWLTTVDSTLTSINDQLSRARDLVVQAASTGSGDANSQNAIATELTQLRASILGLANTTYQGRPVFGGTTAGSAAFAAGATSTIGGQPDIAYVGDSGTVQRRIADGTTVRVDSDATATFGAAGSSVFDAIATVIDHLQNNPAALSGDITAIDAAASRVRTQLTDVGVRQQRVQDGAATVQNRVLDLTSRLTEVEDVDMPSTIVALQTQQVAYQAALGATAKVVQPSLLDFLK
jgi:flagellar hook-associated protein 3 FlgL